MTAPQLTGDVYSIVRNTSGRPTVRATGFGGYLERRWTYDARGRMLEHQVEGLTGCTATGTAIRETLSYFGSGDVASVVNEGGNGPSVDVTFALDYDSRHQLVRAVGTQNAVEV